MERNQEKYQDGDETLLGGFVNESKAMQLLGVKRTTLYYLRNRSDIIYSKIGRKTFYQVKSIQSLLKRNMSDGK